MTENMRQTRLFQEKNPDRINSRVTRGHSDLPKQQEKEESAQQESSSEQEEDDGVPKVKKIHHMTLKAMERKKQLAELAALQGIVIDDKPVIKIPKKRGRPKGYKKNPVPKQEDPLADEVQVAPVAVILQKKEISLRKRDNIKRFLEEDSHEMIIEIQAGVQQLKPVQVQIKLQRIQPQKKIQIQQPVFAPAQNVQPKVHKKRGRKKKIQLMPQLVQPTSVLKVFTVPKLQTYDNYNKYYHKITEELKQQNEVEAPLIFDKLNNPEAYEHLLRSISLKR